MTKLSSRERLRGTTSASRRVVKGLKSLNLRELQREQIHCSLRWHATDSEHDATGCQRLAARDDAAAAAVRDRHGRACRPRQVDAGQGADRDRSRPAGRGKSAGDDDRPRVRLADAAGRPAVSIVDVPGHERFIKNMLAGVGGIDAALLVDRRRRRAHAADRRAPGHPRPARHRPRRGRADQSATPSRPTGSIWCGRRSASCVATTTLAGAPIVAVSALTGEGLPVLLETLEAVLARDSRHAERQRAAPAGRPRLLRRRVRHRRHRHAQRRRDRHRRRAASLSPTSAGRACAACKATRRKWPARCRGAAPRSISPASPPTRSQRGDVLAPPGLMTPEPAARRAAAAPARRAGDARSRTTRSISSPAPPSSRRASPCSTASGWNRARRAWVQFRFRAPIAVLKRRPLHRAPRFAQRDDRRRRGRSIPTRRDTGDSGPRRSRRWRRWPPAAPDEILLQALEQQTDRNQASSGRARRGSPPSRSTRRWRSSSRRATRSCSADPERAPGPTDFAVATTLLADHSPGGSATCCERFHAAQPLRPGMAREEARNRLGIAQPRLFDDLIATAAARGELVRRRRHASLAGLPHDARPGAARARPTGSWPRSGPSRTPRPDPTSSGSTRRRSPRWSTSERSRRSPTASTSPRKPGTRSSRARWPSSTATAR